MDRKPTKDQIEAMQKMVKDGLSVGMTKENIIKDILGWGDQYGITEKLILEEIKEYQKPISPAPMEPINEQEQKWTKAQIKKMSMHERDLALLEYAQGAVKGGHAVREETYLKMVKTRRDYFESSMTDEFVEFICKEIYKENLARRLKELKKLFKKRSK